MSRLLILLLLALPLSARTRVVLLSIDAASDVILDRLLSSHALKGGAFEQIARRGVVAESMTPAAVSSTPVSHPTMFSGAWPSTHGITGVALPSADINGDLRIGFSVPSAVDRLWAVAQRGGKRVICLSAPGAEATSPESTCTETVTFGEMSKAGNEPSGSLPTTGEITEEEYVARAERYADFVSDAVKERLARSDWDLLVTYIPLIDAVEHRYLVDDPRQADYGERKRYAEFIERGYRKIDAIVGSWIAASPDTNFIFVSDHGMIATHSVVLVNNALAAAGLRVGGADAEVRAISSGASVQVYVNAKRRFAHGTIDDKDVPGGIARVVRVLRDLHVFRTITTDLASVNLQNPNAGDVYASAKPGWGLSSRFDPAVPMIVPSTLSPATRARVSRSPAEEAFLKRGFANELSAGVHGHQPGDRRTQAIFYAIGPDVPRKRAGTITMIDVAPTVLQLLGVPRPSYMTGHPVFAQPVRK
jgi:predicted AlkP superfamily phosphohydrolase/phosphomutase